MGKNNNFDNPFNESGDGVFRRGVPVPAQTQYFEQWITLLEEMQDYLAEQQSEQAEFAGRLVRTAKTYSAPEDIPNVMFLVASEYWILKDWSELSELWKVTQEILDEGGKSE